MRAASSMAGYWRRLTLWPEESRESRNFTSTWTLRPGAYFSWRIALRMESMRMFTGNRCRPLLLSTLQAPWGEILMPR